MDDQRASPVLASRAVRKQKPLKQRVAELEELTFQLQGALHTFGSAVLVLREEMEAKFGRPIARKALPVRGGPSEPR